MKTFGAGPLLIAALLFTGCGGDGDGNGDASAPETTADAEPSDAGACGLLTLDEVSGLFGRTAELTPVEGAPEQSTSCSWSATEDLGSGTDTVWQLQLQAYGHDGNLDPGSLGGDPEPIDDLGDEAYVSDSALTGLSAGYVDGDKSVLLRYTIVLGDAPDPSEQTDEVVDLLRAVHDRF